MLKVNAAALGQGAVLALPRPGFGLEHQRSTQVHQDQELQERAAGGGSVSAGAACQHAAHRRGYLGNQVCRLGELCVSHVRHAER